MQKSSITQCLLGLVVAVSLSSCEFTVNGDLSGAECFSGNCSGSTTTSYPSTSEQVIAPDSCRERTMERTDYKDSWDCSTPGTFNEMVKRIEEVDTGTIRVSLARLWDGSFPRLQKLEMLSSETGTSKRRLRCVVVDVPEIYQDWRTYECLLLADGHSSSYYQMFKIAELRLQSEHCPAWSEYKARMPYESCYEDEYYANREYQFDVYHLGQKLPTLLPTDARN